MNRDAPLWEKPLNSLDRCEWEALCDGCGRCCVHKLEDEETGVLYATNVACKLLDRRNGRCLDYNHRMKRVSDCVKLDRRNLDGLDWLPETCAYRLRAAGEPLPRWHYLISGSRETVHEAGQSTRGWTVSEDDAGELEHHVVERRSEAGLEAALPLPIEIRRLRSARRFHLRFDEAAGMLKLTCPLRASRRSALAWALDQRDWIESQLARAEPLEPFLAGATIPIEGREITIVWREEWPRTPSLTDTELRCGGPDTGLRRRIEQFLKARARDTISSDIAEYAAAAGTAPHSVTIGDAATRWGSCSSDGRIRMSWRLILAEPQVRRYVAAHEVAHLVHLNHGPEFKALEAQLFGPGVADAKSALRRIGPRLRRIGRGD